MGPLTDQCPKPLLKVGQRPLLETIILNFINYGFHNFYVSVNYKADMIKQYFGDGSRWNVSINYIEEPERMGTAGSLSLLPKKSIKEPLIIMNGDLLTKANFRHLLDFHLQHKAEATMCVREYSLQIPYGVVTSDRHRLTAINEKPTHRFFVNAGIYVLQPEVLNQIPRNQYMDMPSLFDLLIKNQQETAVFPIREYWLDIGRISDFEQANNEYISEFCT